MCFRLLYCVVSVLALSDKNQVTRDEFEPPLIRYFRRTIPRGSCVSMTDRYCHDWHGMAVLKGLKLVLCLYRERESVSILVGLWCRRFHSATGVDLFADPHISLIPCDIHILLCLRMRNSRQSQRWQIISLTISIERNPKRSTSCRPDGIHDNLDIQARVPMTVSPSRPYMRHTQIIIASRS